MYIYKNVKVVIVRGFTWYHIISICISERAVKPQKIFFYAPGLKGPPGASSNWIVRPFVCLSICLSVILSRLQTKCNI